MRQQGYAVLSPEDVRNLLGAEALDFLQLQLSWNALPLDAFLRDGGRYRRRRHASYIIENENIIDVPHRAHWQPLLYNALHGGMRRLFEPVDTEVVGLPLWRKLLLAMAALCSDLQPVPRWFVEAHQFRIDTTNGIGRPTPEGAHRDGVDFVAVLLMGRTPLKGGESRVFELHGSHGQRFTLIEPGTLLLLDDARVIHETTPIQPLVGVGRRDTLVLTYRSGGFLEPQD